MEEYDIIFFEAFKEEENELKQLLETRDYRCYYTFQTIQEAPNNIKSKIISVRTQSILPIEWSKHLKAIVTRSTGYDHVTEYREKIKQLPQPTPQLQYCHLPDYSKRSCGEHAMLLWTLLLKKFKVQMRNVKHFKRDNITGREVYKKRIAVIGVGRIGGEVVKIARGLSMDVVGCDIVKNEILEKEYDLKYLPLEEALKGADIVVCSLPLTKLTEGMLNYDILSRTVNPRAVFVNVSRGECSPTSDLYRLLMEKKLSGVGLDVYLEEKALAAVLRKEIVLEDIKDEKVLETVKLTLKMMDMDNVIFTPHNAFNSEESVKRKSERTVENIIEYMEKGRFLTPIPFLKK